MSSPRSPNTNIPGPNSIRTRSPQRIPLSSASSSHSPTAATTTSHLSPSSSPSPTSSSPPKHHTSSAHPTANKPTLKSPLSTTFTANPDADNDDDDDDDDDAEPDANPKPAANTIITKDLKPSPRHPQSTTPSASAPASNPPISHLLAAKRALASTSTTTPIMRANDLVTATRVHVEQAAVLRARNRYLQRACRGQVRQLRGMVTGLRRVGEAAEGEFRNTIKALDAADARLKKTLATLRNTSTHAALHSHEPPKSLYTFVDEHSIDTVTAALRASIDAYRDASDTLLDSTAAFDEAVGEVDDAIEAASAMTTTTVVSTATSADTDSTRTESEKRKRQGSADPAPLIPAHLKRLESHATEMADLLHGLVRHYDLCVTALRHSDDGGEAAFREAARLEAAQRASADAGADADANANASASSTVRNELTDFAYHTADSHPVAPLSSAAEREEMLAVLAKDAAEVDNIVATINERAAEMEADFAALEKKLALFRREDEAFRAVAQKLQRLGSGQVPAFVRAGGDFLAGWQEEKARIGEKLAELEALREFYEGFLTAYDGLLVEVGRRRGVQVRMQKILSEAVEKVDRLYQEDLNEREAFKADQGEHLPSDIWPGLTKMPVRYEFRKVDPAAESLPDIPAPVLQGALQRMNKKA